MGDDGRKLRKGHGLIVSVGPHVAHVHMDREQFRVTHTASGMLLFSLLEPRETQKGDPLPQLYRREVVKGMTLPQLARAVQETMDMIVTRRPAKEIRSIMSSAREAHRVL